MRRDSARRPPVHSRAFTLVELMVAMAISLLVILGAITLLLDSRQAYHTAELMARLQERGRFALDTLEPDIRLAAYWGLAGGRAPITGSARRDEPTPDGLAVAGDCGPNFALDLQTPVQGSNDRWEYDCAPYGAGVVPGTDVLTVRHAGLAPAPPEAGRLQLHSDRESIQLMADGVVPAGFADPPLSETRDLVVTSYYLSRDSVQGRGVPSLRRKRLVTGPAMADEEVVPQVEDFQLRLGADTTGDGVPNLFADPDRVPEGSAIVAVRIWLLLRSGEADGRHRDHRSYRYAGHTRGPFEDRRHRLLVQRTIGLRNLGPGP